MESVALRLAAPSSASSWAMCVCAVSRSVPSLFACSLALSRLVLRSESSVLVELASCSAFCREDSRLDILDCSSLFLVVCSDSCLLRLEISSSSDSIVADFDATCALRSSMDAD
jgi:hypothetical protein